MQKNKGCIFILIARFKQDEILIRNILFTKTIVAAEKPLILVEKSSENKI